MSPEYRIPTIQEAAARGGNLWRYGTVQDATPEIEAAVDAYVEALAVLREATRFRPANADLPRAAYHQVERTERDVFRLVWYRRNHFVTPRHVARVDYYVSGHAQRVVILPRSSPLACRAGRRAS